MNIIWKVVLGIISIFIIAITVLFIWAYSQTKMPDLVLAENDSLEAKIEKAETWLNELQENNHFNGAVLMIKNDTVLLKAAYGFSSADESEVLNTSSMFRLASVSKQFTASGIMLLKQQQKLDFDDAITKYLPDLPYKNVTIRHLLNHTSGIPDRYMNFPETHSEDVGDLLTNTKVVSILAKENTPLEFQPNERQQYSNIGYVLLAAIIEVVSEQTFEDFMKSEIFQPLGMKETRVWNLRSKDSDFDNKTASFENIIGDKQTLKPEILDGVTGDGAVFSSVNDFQLWNQFWYSNTLIAQDIMKEAFNMPTLTNGELSNYGFGWVISEMRNAVWHNGSWLGARTLIIRNTELKNCIVILDNSSSPNTDKISSQLSKVLK